MRQLDRKLTSPHFLAVFQGGHALPPDDIAMDALAWMELQAMQSGRRSRDDALVGRMLERRRARIAATTGPTETVYMLHALVSDFTGLRDVSAEASRLEQMAGQPDVRKALKRERDADDAEGRMLGEIFELESRLGDDSRHDALLTLRDRLSKLSRKAAGEADTPERSQARRVLRSITAGASGRVQDRDYLTLLEQYRLPSDLLRDRQARPGRQQQLDRIGEVLVGDVMVAALDAQEVGLHQHIDGAEAFGGFELVARELDLEAVGIVEIDGVHEATVALNEVDAAFAQASGSLHERRPRDVEGDVLHAADLARRVSSGVLA